MIYWDWENKDIFVDLRKNKCYKKYSGECDEEISRWWVCQGKVKEKVGNISGALWLSPAFAIRQISNLDDLLGQEILLSLPLRALEPVEKLETHLSKEKRWDWNMVISRKW